ncbi:MAG: ParB/RepB/Spo0J family partition protein [Ruminococcus sp.]|nr:ParB/RepB/Spo0J family partition protein [Ruminococcus sp.]
MLRRDSELPIELLKPHPKNPRKDVGDVTELAESIKANGIFQPLTVLPGDTVDGYTVVIGHRRLAAAKLAGLELVPCNVAEMTEQEQVSTMLLENMQRNDLTVYEQAQGFQMMLDLGETEQSIAEKTGFSKTTIKHRVKLLELDKAEFERSQERGATLADYIELEKITDPKEKNKALKTIGTDNFKWTLNSTIRAQNEKTAKDAWRTFVKKLKLKKAEDSFIWKGEKLISIRLNSEPDETEKQKVTGFVDKGEAKYYAFYSGWVYILGDVPKTKGKKNVKSAKEKALEKKLKYITVLEQQAKELREAFVKNYLGGHEDIIIRAVIEAQTSLYTWSDREKKLKDYLSIKQEDTLKDSERYKYLMKRRPEIVLLGYLALNYEADVYKTKVVDKTNGKYQKNPTLETWYATLTKLGYRISDDETRLLDGTHECFKEEGTE